MELLDLPVSRAHVNDEDEDDEGEEDEAKQQRARGAIVRRLRSAHSGPVRTLQLSPDGLLLASATARAAHVWDAKTLEARPALSGGGPIVTFVPHTPSASTNILLSASAFDTTMRVPPHTDLIFLCFVFLSEWLAVRCRSGTPMMPTCSIL